MIELMLAVAIMGVLLTIAAPSYEWVTGSNRISFEASDLRNDLEFARSEALKRGQFVVVCPSTDQSNCLTDSDSWAGGWIVVAAQAGTASSCTLTSGLVLRARNSFPSTDTITYTPKTDGNTSVCFNRLGFIAADYLGRFKVDTTPSSSRMRCLSTFAAGHVQILRQAQTDSEGEACS